jgi:hypothetical protein
MQEVKKYIPCTMTDTFTDFCVIALKAMRLKLTFIWYKVFSFFCITSVHIIFFVGVSV